jgi:cell shape-determining protein MreD
MMIPLAEGGPALALASAPMSKRPFLAFELEVDRGDGWSNAIMVYAALTGNILQVVLLAGLGGTWLDCLSANPLGLSVLPLFAVGFGVHLARELILKDETFAQFMFGLIASALTPLLTLVLLLSVGHSPLLGWGTLWQWLVMSLVGAAATPLWFGVFEWLHRTFAHARSTTSSFRPDREIRRGR